MLGVDQLTQERWRQEVRRESAAERRQRLLAQDLENAEISVEDDAGRDVSNLLAQMGRPLSCQQVMDKLKLSNPRFVFERSKSFPDLMGIYVNIKERNQAGSWEDKRVFVCGMESGIMPEFSVLHKTKIRVPDKDIFGNVKPTREVKWKETDTFESETRGWRTVLIRLLHAGLVTRLDVEKHFGWTPSRESKKWYERTK